MFKIFTIPSICKLVQRRSYATGSRHILLRIAVGAVGTMLCSSICLVGATTPVYAGTKQGEARQEVVRFADLNLSHDAGRKALRSRLHGAARQVCKDDGPARVTKTSETQCVRKALDEALADADAMVK